MATKTDIMTIARNYLRDFPKFFQTTFATAGRTYELGHPNIDTSALWVAFVPNSAGASAGNASATVLTSYDLDERNGLLRMSAPLNAGTLMVEGYYYEWLTPSDLSFYADMAIHLNTHNLSITLEQMAPAVSDVVGIHTLIEALWGLLSEYSRDIDVITSESVHIPASQRFRMVESLLDYWMAEYKRRAQALNIGLDRLEVLTLRRVSRTTGRLVPVYKAREIGDHGPIERLWPPIDPGVIELEDTGDDLREDVYIDTEAPTSYVSQTGYY